LVFIFHFWGFFQEKLNFYADFFLIPFKAGHLGIDIFFVLSGLLLFLSIARDGQVKIDFFYRRFWRLVPLAFTVTILLFILKGPSFWFSILGIKNLIFHLLFLQSLSLDTYWNLNPVMWTLTLEMLFIIILPLLIYLSFKRKKVFLSLIFSLLILNFLYRFFVFNFFEIWSVKEKIFYSEQLWGRFDQFALGIFSGVLLISPQNILKKITPFVSFLLSFLGLLGLIISFFIFASLGSDFRSNLFLQIFLHFFTAFSFVIFLGGFLSNQNKFIKKIFAPLIFEKFGKISYSFFLWHFPVLSVLKKFIDSPLWGFLLALLFSIILSMLSYIFIEKNLYLFFRKVRYKV